jgi:GNAT superfamily N-acetyltransferase
LTIEIRPATANDLSAVLSLLGELNADDPPLDPAGTERVWADVRAQPGRTLLVASLGGEVVGTVDCLVMPNLSREGRPIMFVENMVVAAAHRREGVGRRLMESALLVARRANCYKVQLMAAPNEGVHEFYRACGFTPKAHGFWYRLAPRRA